MKLPPQVDTLVRNCFRAVILDDRATLEQCALPNPRLDAVLSRPWPLDKRAEGVEQIAGMQISVRDMQPDRLYLHVWFRGLLQPLIVVQTESGWRVDMRWWIAAMQEPDAMRAAAREFLFAMMTCDLDRLSELATDVRGTEVLTSDPPPAGEVGQLAHVCQAMQLAELELGESFPDLIGGTERVRDEHRRHGYRVLVGLFNGGEVPFLMKEVDGQWKVSPFHFIRAAAMAAGGTVG